MPGTEGLLLAGAFFSAGTKAGLPSGKIADDGGRQRIMDGTAENIRAFMEGHPVHVVNL